MLAITLRLPREPWFCARRGQMQPFTSHSMEISPFVVSAWIAVKEGVGVREPI